MSRDSAASDTRDFGGSDLSSELALDMGDNDPSPHIHVAGSSVESLDKSRSSSPPMDPGQDFTLDNGLNDKMAESESSLDLEKNSKLSLWLKKCIVVSQGNRIPISDTYAAYTKEVGTDPCNVAWFGKRLRQLFPAVSLKNHRKKDDWKQTERVYVGIDLGCNVSTDCSDFILLQNGAENKYMYVYPKEKCMYGGLEIIMYITFLDTTVTSVSVFNCDLDLEYVGLPIHVAKKDIGVFFSLIRDLKFCNGFRIRENSTANVPVMSLKECWCINGDYIETIRSKVCKRVMKISGKTEVCADCMRYKKSVADRRQRMLEESQGEPSMIEMGDVKGVKKDQRSSLKYLKVYLDYNATTPLEEEVLESINDALETAWGNPSSVYEEGTKAKLLIQEARSHVAEMVGGRDTDIIFTSGGTEANSLVIHSALKYFWEHLLFPDGSRRSVFPHVITSNLEHDSVKLVLEKYKEEGKIDLSVVEASKLTGRVEVEDVINHIRQTPDVSTCLITIMSANNETGIIQPIAEICERVRSLKSQKIASSRILLHTDAAQALGKIPVDVTDLGVDYLTIVGHKFYGPRIGAVYVRGPANETPLYPMFFGGGQERNFRPGTENTGMIAGLGKAAQLVVENINTYSSHMETIRNYLEERLQKTFGAMVHFNGKFKGSSRLPNTCNVSLLGKNLKGGDVLANVRHLQASVGAACHAQDQPSHILLAIGVPREIASNALRLSVGRHTTKEDIDLIIKDLTQTVARLKEK